MARMRILDLQVAARELGRLRTGLTVVGANGRSRPTSSDTWIVTSYSEDYIRAAAAEWGGTPEPWQPMGNGKPQWRVITDAVSLEAVLPPGDPMSQSNELWDRGGATRRCDGLTELISDEPCLCKREFGDDWFREKKGTVCSPTTRLSVLLPASPDLGVWRIESHGYYAAVELGGLIDTVRRATDAMVPVRLRIEQRTKTAGGKTSQYPVVVVELRDVTTAQILAGSFTPMGAIEATVPDTAPNGLSEVETAPFVPASVAHGPDYWVTEVAQALGRAELQDVWGRAKASNEGSPGLRDAITARLSAFPVPQAEDSRDEDEADVLWIEVQRVGPPTLSELDADFQAKTGTVPDGATAEDMRRYLAATAVPA